MRPAFHLVKRRDGAQYRAFRRKVLAERPICEDCNLAPSEIVAHLVQPCLGGELTGLTNVLALCKPCDRLRTRTTPVLRRRPTRKVS